MTVGNAGIDALSGSMQLLKLLRGGSILQDIGSKPPIFEKAAALQEGAEVGVSSMHKFKKPLREGLWGVIFVWVVGKGNKGGAYKCLP